MPILQSPWKEKEDKRQSEPIMYLPKIPTQVSTLHTNTPTGSLTTNSDCLTRSGSLKHRSAGSALKQIQISKRSTHEKPKSVISNHSVTQIKLQNVKETNPNSKKRISNSLIASMSHQTTLILIASLLKFVIFLSKEHK